MWGEPKTGIDVFIVSLQRYYNLFISKESTCFFLKELLTTMHNYQYVKHLCVHYRHAFWNNKGDTLVFIQVDLINVNSKQLLFTLTPFTPSQLDTLLFLTDKTVLLMEWIIQRNDRRIQKNKKHPPLPLRRQGPSPFTLQGHHGVFFTNPEFTSRKGKKSHIVYKIIRVAWKLIRGAYSHLLSDPACITLAVCLQPFDDTKYAHWITKKLFGKQRWQSLELHY